MKLDIPQAEQKAFQLVNELRTRAGLPALLWDSQLAGIARAHSNDMLARNSFDHADATGGLVQQRAAEASIAAPDQTGENISKAVDFVDPVQAAVTGWQNSAKHYQNIVFPQYTHAGLGIAQSTDLHTVYFTEDFWIKPNVSGLLGAQLGKTTAPVPDQSGSTAPLAGTNLIAATSGIPTGFIDVAGTNEFATFVKKLADKGIVHGQDTTQGKTFFGNNPVTREQIVGMLVRALALTISDATVPFSDIGTSTLKKEIATAYEKHITTGYPDNTFHPLQPVTRAEASTLIARAFNFSGTGTVPFTDVPAQSSLLSGISALYGKGIISGRSTTLFAPNATVTRFEVSKMIAKALEIQ